MTAQRHLKTKSHWITQTMTLKRKSWHFIYGEKQKKLRKYALQLMKMNHEKETWCEVIKNLKAHIYREKKPVNLFILWLRTFPNIFQTSSNSYGVYTCRGQFFFACFYFFLFFSIWVFFHEHWRITGLQKGEGISLIPQYHFHQLHRHLEISRRITAESSSLHIASSRTRTGNLWFLSPSR